MGVKNGHPVLFVLTMTEGPSKEQDTNQPKKFEVPSSQSLHPPWRFFPAMAGIFQSANEGVQFSFPAHLGVLRAVN
jgi:hypothetical protein